MFPATTTLSAHRLRERSLRTKISRVEPPEPRENIESSTSNTERRNERGFALPFDVRRWMFDVGCSSGFIRGQTGGSLPRFRRDFQGHVLAVTQHDDVHRLTDLHGVERVGVVVNVRDFLAGEFDDDIAAFQAGLFRRTAAAHARSEERRVGKECRSRWSPYH